MRAGAISSAKTRALQEQAYDDEFFATCCQLPTHQHRLHDEGLSVLRVWPGRQPPIDAPWPITCLLSGTQVIACLHS